MEKNLSTSQNIVSSVFRQGSHRKTNNDTRQIAFQVICQIFERQHTPLETALHNVISLKTEQRDRAAAFRMVLCFLRQKGTLTALIEPFLKRSPPERVLWIMMLGAAQILFLETPPYAAICATVELARQNGFPKMTGLVNAVLRKIVNQGPGLLEGLDHDRLNIPVWLWQKWSQAGFFPRQLAQSLNMEPPLDIHLKAGGVAPAGGENLIGNHWRYPSGTKVEELAGYEQGQFWVQDVAASLPVLLMNVKAGEKVIDLCAAPGGKTVQLLQAGAQVVAVEKKAQRFKRLKENLGRMQVNADLVMADAACLSYKEMFDAVLLDAPCSATGIFRRHPDVLHLKGEHEVKAMAAVQRKLIRAALTYLKKGGRLIYSVCSLQRAEAEEQAAFIASLDGVRFLPFQPLEIPFLPQALTKEGWIRTLPLMWAEKGGMDGFFIVRFIKE